MTAGTTETQLRQLREGSHLRYHGVEWNIEDYSTYTDANGYETEEWLLKSLSGKAYYLLREVDPQNPETLIHWYLAEELRYPTLIDPQTSRDRLLTLGDDMRSHKTPDAELKLFNRVYAFESQTEGDYESESDGTTRHRITWDYWDTAHLWNLALEAWSDGTFVVYSTREVQPADFAEIQVGDRAALSPGQGFNSDVAALQGWNKQKRETRNRNLAIAWIITIVGFFLMLSGI